MHTNNPVDQDCPHIFIDVLLSLHVGSVWLRAMFRLLHVFLDGSTIFADMVYVRQSGLVDLAHPR